MAVSFFRRLNNTEVSLSVGSTSIPEKISPFHKSTFLLIHRKVVAPKWSPLSDGEQHQSGKSNIFHSI
eukprot:TRINITY_DN4586_c0_g1_i1.p2 TRINITY_DN4586_c0_g1~~TRINITY_DN4586_c0_g1_i1.p2  ORF type:complete len:68 (-),score=15.42 TRINITY_DN4586_c0_g1_i1:115-318(-)